MTDFKMTPELREKLAALPEAKTPGRAVNYAGKTASQVRGIYNIMRDQNPDYLSFALGDLRAPLKSLISHSNNWDYISGYVFDGANTGRLKKEDLIAVGLMLDIFPKAFLDMEVQEQDSLRIEVDPEANEAAEPAKSAPKKKPEYDPMALMPNDGTPTGAQVASELDAANAKILEKADHANNELDKLAPFIADGPLKTIKNALHGFQADTSVALESAKRSVATLAANAGTNQKTNTQDDGAPRDAAPLSSETVRKVFGINKPKPLAALKVTLWDAQDAPSVDDKFIYDETNLQDVLVSINRCRTVFLSGPAGTGKTSLPREIAARTGRPFVRIAHDRNTEPLELIGSRYPSPDGGTVWRDGVLIQAIRKAGNIILLDEPTFCRAGVLAVYQTLLDHRSFTIKETGEVVKCAQGVTFVIADNTAGNGDDTGRYADTNTMNLAFMDRSAKVLEISYLTPEKENVALVGRTGCIEPLATRLVMFANMTRDRAEKGTMTAGLSFRRLVELAFDLQDGIEPKRAIQNTILNFATPDDATEIDELVKAHLNMKELAQLASGGEVPAVKANMAQPPVRAQHDDVIDSYIAASTAY